MASSTPTTSISSTGCITMKKELEHLTYKWVIKGYKLLPQSVTSYILSPIFRSGNNEEEWKLCFYTQDPAGIDCMEIALHLHSRKSKSFKIKVNLKLSIPQIGITQNWEHTYNRAGTGWKGSAIVGRSKLLESCINDDTVTIICEMDFAREIPIESIDTTKCIDPLFDSQEGQLCQDFRLLYKESRISDFSVIVGSQKFPAHKVVLAARSPVFMAMFENKKTEENIKNEVKIEKMEPAVVEAMLEFFYTDEVTNLEELAFGLLEAADKYDVQRLRSMCEKTLYKTLDTENAAVILLYADRHRSHKLKEHVMIFMVNHLGDVIKSQSYKCLKDPELLKELMQSVAIRQ